MILTIVNVIYVLVAIAMIVLILMQRGAGAAAGSGFGAGASATVFGARGSANFLSTATKWLAVVFFAMSLGMAWNATRGIRADAPVAEDLGVMAELPPQAAPQATPAPAADLPAIPAAPGAAPVESGAPAPAAGDPSATPPVEGGDAPAAEAAPAVEATPAAAPAEGSQGG